MHLVPGQGVAVVRWSRAEKACLWFIAGVIAAGVLLVATMPLYDDWLMAPH